MPAPRPRHPKSKKNAYSPRHARAMPAPTCSPNRSLAPGAVAWNLPFGPLKCRGCTQGVGVVQHLFGKDRLSTFPNTGAWTMVLRPQWVTCGTRGPCGPCTLAVHAAHAALETLLQEPPGPPGLQGAALAALAAPARVARAARSPLGPEVPRPARRAAAAV
eukprot:gene8112-biopygen4610